MTHTIHKYQLRLDAIRVDVEIPMNAEFLHFGYQGTEPYVWYEVDEANPKETVSFEIIGTGWDVPAGCKHLSSNIIGNYVWHLYKAQK